jgi:hypothetical protein
MKRGGQSRNAEAQIHFFVTRESYAESPLVHSGKIQLKIFFLCSTILFTETLPKCGDFLTQASILGKSNAVEIGFDVVRKFLFG